MADAKENPGYNSLLAACPVIGTWDDHDYGINDGDKSFRMKRESQQLFLDFLDEPVVSPRRARAGVFDARTFGPPGRQVCVILLDVRTHRDVPRTNGDILGEAQWRWLGETLNATTSQMHIFCSGSQILPSAHPYEKWADYPRSAPDLAPEKPHSRRHSSQRRPPHWRNLTP
jgi:alkaline phosphatase D